MPTYTIIHTIPYAVPRKHRSQVCKAPQLNRCSSSIQTKMVRVRGFEPRFHAPKARVITRLYDTLISRLNRLLFTSSKYEVYDRHLEDRNLPVRQGSY